MPITPAPPAALPDIEPVRTLLSRVRAELSAEFRPAGPIRVSRAPGRLDVMGGIADYTGSLVCQFPLDCAAAVAIQEREDRQLQIFSFNLFDQNKPFTFRIPLDALTAHPVQTLRREFNAPGRRWAGYIAGCLIALHVHRQVIEGMARGMNIAICSTVPMGAGLSSSAAIEVATMINLRDHLWLGNQLDPVELAVLCQWAENHAVGAPCGVMDQITSCLGEAGMLLRLVCQPHDLRPALKLPEGVRVVGIDSKVGHDISGPAYARTRCAAFMAHRFILEKMRQMGATLGRQLIGDPMRGYLANLEPDDYKNLFRAAVPESIAGKEFLEAYGPTIDPVTTIEPDVQYSPRHAADHHVLEARRVRRFVESLELADAQSGSRRAMNLDRAGHLMYGSHQSYEMDAKLGAVECDMLVKLVRDRERAGLYGARITGGGCGGTVAVLANISESSDAALAEILEEYERRTGHKPQIFAGSSSGAWHVGTTMA